LNDPLLRLKIVENGWVYTKGILMYKSVKMNNNDIVHMICVSLINILDKVIE